MPSTLKPIGVSAPSLQQVRMIVMQNLLDWNTPRSLSLYLLMREGAPEDWSSLRETDPLWFRSAVEYAEFAYPDSLLAKIEPGVVNRTADPTGKAKERFFLAEELCRKTNLRLSYSKDPTGRLGDLIARVRKDLSWIMGRVTPQLLDSFVERGGWGNGCTSSVKRSNTEGWLTLHQKLIGTQSSTTALLRVAGKLQSEITGMGALNKVPQDFNVVSFVPKNWKTHRAIAVEPSLNAYLQRGVGVYLASRLRKAGCDLAHGWRHNQRLALRGSLTGDFATIDLSMASDTLSFKTVRYLIQDESWVSLLALLRTPYFKLGDKIAPYSKWSSMGNGYTFELESLIFLCCVRATVEPWEDYAVFGDDLVVPSHAVGDLATLLNFLGFIFNPEKSFTSGSFRESCGADFFDGVAVRGLFPQERNPESWYTWYNWLSSESLLPKCRTTMSLIRRLCGLTTYAPCNISGAFKSFPLPNRKMEMVRGRFQGRIGWWFNRVVFQPHDRLLSEHSDIGAVAAYCRLAHGGESIVRETVRESKQKSGRWKLKRSFIDDEMISQIERDL